MKEMKAFASDYLKDEENTVSMSDPQEGSSLVAPAHSEEGEFCAPFLGKRGR